MSGATDVDPALREIRVTFSKSMLNKSWSFAQVSEGTFPARSESPHYAADGKTCVWPIFLEPGKDYVIWVNSERSRGFKDSNRTPALPYLLVFKTRAAESGIESQRNKKKR
jgi:RNA polymerase sigma-70 factor (ECF subfamily)